MSLDIDTLVSQLTLEEKVSLLAGADTWQTQEISRLGIGSIKTTDGPSGARGSSAVDGAKAAFLPGPVCQAATWSREHLRSIGRLLSREARTKGADVLLAPTICCARNPLGGRNFECFGEDAFLTGSLAVEYVAGVQETGQVVATPKHFVANEQEHDRFTIDAQIDEKALREIYLRPFEMVVKSKTPPGCLMTSYNVVNGAHMDMNQALVVDVLRGEWAFGGLVMSDWGGTNSTVQSLVAGCDLEMPGPPDQRGAKLAAALREATHDSALDAALDASVCRVLTLAKRMQLLGLDAQAAKATRHRPEQSATSPEDIQLMRDVAASGIVLLKNTHKTLPLVLSGTHHNVAFIGPNALDGVPGGGGSATMNPQYISRPAEAFAAAAEAKDIHVTVHHALGAFSKKWLPLFSPDQWHVDGSPVGGQCVQLDFFAGTDLSGPVVASQYRGSSLLDLSDTAPSYFQTDPVPPYSYRASSFLTPKTTGSHSFGLASVGEARLLIDGQPLLDTVGWTERGESFYTFGCVEVRKAAPLQAGQTYVVTVETWTKPLVPDMPAAHAFACHPSVRIGYQEELPSDAALRAEAVRVADACDYAVVVLGLDDEWESEGYDRQDMRLPGGQDALVAELLHSCARPERLVFVNLSGSPVEFPWLDDAGTLLQAWYCGQEAGNALADILLGTALPAGRLPISWPKKYADLPFATDKETWPGVDGKVHYKEQTAVGYRYYHRCGRLPAFWFGYGLCYTEFNTEISAVTEDEDGWQVAFSVTNTGNHPGHEVVQLYAWPEAHPEQKALVAFWKTDILPQKTSVSGVLNPQKRDLASWEDGKWTLKQGPYVFAVLKHAGDAEGSTAKVNVLARTWSPAQ